MGFDPSTRVTMKDVRDRMMQSHPDKIVGFKNYSQEEKDKILSNNRLMLAKWNSIRARGNLDQAGGKKAKKTLKKKPVKKAASPKKKADKK